MNFGMNLLKLPNVSRESQALPSPLRHWLAKMLDLKVVCAAAMLVAACPSCTSASEYSNSAPAKVSAPLTQSQKEAALAAALGTAPASDSDSMATSSTTVAPETSATNAANVLTNGMDELDEVYKLAAGDSIDYQVVEDEEDPKAIAVTDSGDVVVPYIGRYPASGKTCKQLAVELKKALEKKYYYRATVIISVDTMVTHGVVYIIGGVKAPGPLEMPKDDTLTISKAILRAGGFDDFADEKHVRVTRKTDGGTNEVLTVNVRAILDKGHTDTDPQAEPGDLIYVPEKTIRF
jgi:polysaccharide biosynthesis/export protein